MYGMAKVVCEWLCVSVCVSMTEVEKLFISLNLMLLSLFGWLAGWFVCLIVYFIVATADVVAVVVGQKAFNKL